jgi:hypothetical protein
MEPTEQTYSIDGDTILCVIHSAELRTYYFNFPHRLTRSSIDVFSGVEEVNPTEKYSISIRISRLFNWADIHTFVMDMLRNRAAIRVMPPAAPPSVGGMS